MALSLPVISTKESTKREDAINQLFDTLDTDNSNSLDVEEFKKLGLVMLRSKGQKIQLKDMSTDDARAEMHRADPDHPNEELSRNAWIKFAQKGLSGLDDEAFFRRMTLLTADAQRVIEEEEAQKQRHARKRQKKKNRRSRRSQRRRENTYEEEETSGSSTPTIGAAASPEPTATKRDHSPSTLPLSQVAAASPIGRTVLSAREEQNTSDSARAAVASSRKRNLDNYSPSDASSAHRSADSVEMSKAPALQITSKGTRRGRSVEVDRQTGAALHLDTRKLHGDEFQQATVLVSSLAHLHKAARTKEDKPKPEKKEKKTNTNVQDNLRRLRRRASILEKASKAW